MPCLELAPEARCLLDTEGSRYLRCGRRRKPLTCDSLRVSLPALCVSDLTVTYKKFVALDGVTFTARSGSLVGLVGANGAGKSTLFQAVSGLVGIAGGSVCAGDAERGSVQARQRIGFLPEEPVLWPHATVSEHLQFIARAFSVPDWRPKAEVLLERFALTESRDVYGGKLSQGMRRKVALAMVLLHDSTVVLLDEPFNGLDPQAQHELRGMVRDLRAAGTCIILSSHRLAELSTLADEYLVLAGGRVVGQGDLVALRAASGVPSADLESAYLALTS